MTAVLFIAALFIFISLVIVTCVRHMAKLAVRRLDSSIEKERAAFDARINNRLHRP